MKQKTVIALLFVFLLMPAISSAQVNEEMSQGKKITIGQVLSFIKDKISALEQLLILQRQISGSITGSIIQKIELAAGSQTNNCDNYEKICPISPFGTRKEPVPETPTSTIPQITVKYADIKANLAKIVYSISDIRDNQTMLWLNYGTSSSALDHATFRANVSYGITGRHGIDDADFLIVVPSESVCLYASSTSSAFGAFSIYNPNPPIYYFRFEAQNNLGTFFTPSPELPPFSFQFDGFCGEQTYYIDDLQS